MSEHLQHDGRTLSLTHLFRIARLSRVLADEVSHLSTDTYGTVSYMAPELLGQGKFGKPADVYSFGLLSASRWRLSLSKPAVAVTRVATLAPCLWTCITVVRSLLAEVKRTTRGSSSGAGECCSMAAETNYRAVCAVWELLTGEEPYAGSTVGASPCHRSILPLHLSWDRWARRL